MIAYREPSEPMQIAFPDVIGSSTARELMGNVSLLYSPELLVGQTGVWSVASLDIVCLLTPRTAVAIINRLSSKASPALGCLNEMDRSSRPFITTRAILRRTFNEM